MMHSFHLVDIFGWKTNVFRHVALEALSYYAVTPKLFNFFWIDTLIFEIKYFERKYIYVRGQIESAIVSFRVKAVKRVFLTPVLFGRN